MNSNILEIYSEDTQSTLYVESGTTLLDISRQIQTNGSSSKIVAGYCNNRIRDLSYRVYTPQRIRFATLSDSEGIRTYSRSVLFLLERAVRELYPQSQLHILHSVGRGCYAELSGLRKPSLEQLNSIKLRMQDLVSQNIPIVKRKVPYASAIEIYDRQGLTDKLNLLRTCPQCYVSLYNMSGLESYYYGPVVPSTSYLDVFDLELFGDGFVVVMPLKEDPTKLESVAIQPKLFEVFTLSKEWSRILQVDNIGSLNQMALQGNSSELIQVGEALQEKNFARVADHIHHLYTEQGVRLVLIAGPSSSGKTTFSKRLSVQLRVLGLKPQVISLDDYFVERSQTPLDEQGNYDFESLKALDIAHFNSDMNRLFAGEEVELPKFNFQTGSRFYSGRKMKLGESSILIVEGIHGLNPELSSHIDDHLKFKIYASALTTLSIDNTTVIHTTDNRLLRRIVRDHNYRNRTAQATLASWSSVRRGEDNHIFPYQEESDIMFNTSLFFELSILKSHAEPLLHSVPCTSIEYAQAQRLLSLLSNFVDIDDAQLPPTSILREFLGGSSFEY